MQKKPESEDSLGDVFAKLSTYVDVADTEMVAARKKRGQLDEEGER